ncbi:MAG: PepSY domain-containing protein [Planctomycetes bacterium]|nr:PepSY domain-containing protein [Planctomycetota bacterium]
MRFFKLIWEVHKVLGIALGVVLLLASVTGFLLLVKRDWPWLIPPTAAGRAAPLDAVLPLPRVIESAVAAGHPDLRSADDVDRVDFRPKDHVFKVVASRGNFEVQVDASTGIVLSTGVRRTDLIESLHDGRAFGAFVHGTLAPASAIGLGLLVITGYAVWLWPKLARRRRKRGHQHRTTAQ